VRFPSSPTPDHPSRPGRERRRHTLHPSCLICSPADILSGSQRGKHDAREMLAASWFDIPASPTLGIPPRANKSQPLSSSCGAGGHLDTHTFACLYRQIHNPTASRDGGQGTRKRLYSQPPPEETCQPHPRSFASHTHFLARGSSRENSLPQTAEIYMYIYIYRFVCTRSAIYACACSLAIQQARRATCLICAPADPSSGRRHVANTMTLSASAPSLWCLRIYIYIYIYIYICIYLCILIGITV